MGVIRPYIPGQAEGIRQAPLRDEVKRSKPAFRRSHAIVNDLVHPERIGVLATAALRIQRSFRRRAYKFHRKRLIERLLVELRLGVMTARFWAFVALFALLITLLRLPFNNESRLLVRGFVNNLFGLSSLTSLTTQSDIHVGIKDFLGSAESMSPSLGSMVPVFSLSPALLFWRSVEKIPCDSVVQNSLRAGDCPEYCVATNCSTSSESFTNVTFEKQSGNLFVLWNETSVPNLNSGQLSSLTLLLPFFSVNGAGTGDQSIGGLIWVKWDSNLHVLWGVSMLERTNQSTFLWLLFTACLLIVVWLAFVDYCEFLRHWKFDVHSNRKRIISSYLVQCASLISIVVFLIQAAVAYNRSNSTFANEIVTVAGTDWVESPSSGFDAVKIMYETTNHQIYLLGFGVACLFLILLRTSGALALHPRIGLFVHTFTQASGEVIHFTVLLCLVFISLGAVGWLVNSNRWSAYSSFDATLWSQWTIMAFSDIGIIPWNADIWSTSYFVIYTLLILFVLANFFLAIVIDTYFKVRKSVYSKNIDQAVYKDMYDTLRAERIYWREGLPSRALIIAQLHKMKALKTVSVDNLLSCKVFESESACVRFCQFYHSFLFLRPRAFPSNDEEEKRWSKVLDKVSDCLVERETDVELLTKFNKELHEQISRVEKDADTVIGSLGGIIDQSPRRRSSASSSLIRRRLNYIDEYSMRKRLSDRATSLMKIKKLKEYMTKAHNEAEGEVLWQRDLIRKASSSLDRSLRRRTIMRLSRESDASQV